MNTETTKKDARKLRELFIEEFGMEPNRDLSEDWDWMAAAGCPEREGNTDAFDEAFFGS